MKHLINIRGTHGSGKSHLVRRILAHYDQKVPIYPTDRKTRVPHASVCVSEQFDHLYVAGNYHTREHGGGCDSLKSMDWIFKPIHDAIDKGLNVIFEGILAQHSMPRVRELKNHIVGKDYTFHVVYLTTPPELCIESVIERRTSRGNFDELNPTNLLDEHKALASNRLRIKDEGISVHDLGRDDAYEFILERLRL